MNKVSCDVICDLLPLYVDGMVSVDTKDLVEDHLVCCAACRNNCENMRGEVILPVESSVKPLKRFKAVWLRKKILLVLISVLLTAVILFSGMMVYEEVGAVHDFFSPTMVATMKQEDITGTWQRLPVGEDGFLVFDSPFYRKTITWDANCPAGAVFRITDEYGKLVLEEFPLTPGTSFRLDGLENNKNYVVAFKTEGNFVCARFY